MIISEVYSCRYYKKGIVVVDDGGDIIMMVVLTVRCECDSVGRYI